MKSSAQVPPHQIESAPTNPFRAALSLTFIGLSAGLVLWIANIIFGFIPNGNDLQGDLYANTSFIIGYRAISVVFSVVFGIGTYKLTAWQGPAKRLSRITRVVVFASIVYSFGVDVLFNFLQSLISFFMPMVTPLLGNLLHSAALFALFIFCAALTDDCGDPKRAQAMRRLAKLYFGLSLFFSVFWLKFYFGLSQLPNFHVLLPLLSPLVYGYIYLNTARALPHYQNDESSDFNPSPSE